MLPLKNKLCFVLNLASLKVKHSYTGPLVPYDLEQISPSPTCELPPHIISERPVRGERQICPQA